MTNDWIYVSVVSFLVFTGFASFAWRSRVRAATRWLTALDVYAKREIEAERNRQAGQ